MQLASRTHIPDGLLAAITLLSEKPRLGFERNNPALHPGHNVWNFTAASGVSWSLASETHTSHVMGRFMSPDPSGLVYADPSNPQSLNLYSYVMNNPLTNVDPDGLDCVYFNNAGNGVESVDRNSNSGECGSNGGDWINGHVQTAQYFSDSDTWGFRSSDAQNNYLTYANAPGTESDGTTCAGNCDTANGYFQSSNSSPGLFDLSPDQRIQQLAVGVTADSQHSFGCIAQAYGISGVGNAGAVGLGAPSMSKPFAGRGAAQGTSLASKGLAAAADKLGVPRGRYPSPTGGPFSGGQDFNIMRTPNAGRALGRWLPWGVSAASTAYAAYKLGNCL